MKLYIDGEWDTNKSRLLSFAVVAENGDEWYEVFEHDTIVSEWVIENVLSKLGKSPINRHAAQLSLVEFLSRFDVIHIIADWPEDISVLCDLLIVGPGERLDTPPMTLEILRVDSVSDNPHNALADAHGLRRHLTNGVTP